MLSYYNNLTLISYNWPLTVKCHSNSIKRLLRRFISCWQSRHLMVCFLSCHIEYVTRWWMEEGMVCWVGIGKLFCLEHRLWISLFVHETNPTDQCYLTDHIEHWLDRYTDNIGVFLEDLSPVQDIPATTVNQNIISSMSINLTNSSLLILLVAINYQPTPCDLNTDPCFSTPYSNHLCY